jgi:phytoene dehydrogenase-like protein
VIDATVVGGGPNGLAAAATLARAGLSVRVLERAPTIGGGLRTEQLTLPGFRHDVCSAVHPAALASPFFRAFGLAERVPFVVPEESYGHPLGDRPAVIAYRDLPRTVAELAGAGAGRRWDRVFRPLVEHLEGVLDFTGSQLLRMPRAPLTAVRFGWRVGAGSLGPGGGFSGDAATLFAGVAAHAIGPKPALAATGAGLVLASHAHAGGWGLPIGGSAAIAEALAVEIRDAGGEIVTDTEVRSPADVGDSRVTLLDTGPEFLAAYAGDELPPAYRRALGRFRRGDAAAKLDAALDGPIPWRDPRLGRVPTVHLGGSAREIADAERAVADGRIPERPYVLVVQPTVVDPTRAPAGKHVLWAYTHVPHGSTLDPTELILGALEREAPGVRDLVLAAAARSARDLEASNPNDVGGDILGGAVTVRQLLKRPVVSPVPWRTPVAGLYLCSASTPPGPSVQGMNGWFAARTALRDVFGIRDVPFTYSRQPPVE